MSLKKINSIYFHQYQQSIKPICQKHVFKQNTKTEQAQNPSYLKNLNSDMVSYIAKFLSIKDQVNLASTCEILRGKHRFANPGFNIDTIKNVFEDEVTQFINLFNVNNGEFKSRHTIINEINNGTIILPEDPSVMKIGFKVVFSTMDDDEIRDLLEDIKDNISKDLYNKLKYNIYEKNILEHWKTNK